MQMGRYLPHANLYELYKMRKKRAEVHKGWRHWRLQCHCCGGRPALLWILQNTSKTIPLGLGGGLVSIGKNCSAETTAKPRKHQKTTSLGLGGGLVSTGKTKGKRELIKGSTPPTTWLRKTDLKMCNAIVAKLFLLMVTPPGCSSISPARKELFVPGNPFTSGFWQSPRRRATSSALCHELPVCTYDHQNLPYAASAKLCL